MKIGEYLQKYIDPEKIESMIAQSAKKVSEVQRKGSRWFMKIGVFFVLVFVLYHYLMFNVIPKMNTNAAVSSDEIELSERGRAALVSLNDTFDCEDEVCAVKLLESAGWVVTRDGKDIRAVLTMENADQSDECIALRRYAYILLFEIKVQCTRGEIIVNYTFPTKDDQVEMVAEALGIPRAVIKTMLEEGYTDQMPMGDREEERSGDDSSGD